MARLIRTEKEVEGRREEVWLVVEEDALEQWPAGPLEVVGRPGAADRRARARARRGDLHRRPPAARDAAHGRAALAARPRARARGSTSRRRSRAPGVRAAIGPGDCDALAASAATRAPPSPPSAPRRARRPTRRVALIDVEWEVLEPLLDADEAVARGEVLATPRARARRRRARPRRGRRRRRGDLPHADRAPQLARDARLGLPLGRRDARGLHLDAGHLGRPPRGRDASSGSPPDHVRVVCEFMGGGFGAKTDAGRLHADRGRARDAHGPARALHAHAPRGERLVRQPQRDDPAARRGRALRRHAHRARRRLRERGRLVRLERVHRGADADALRLPEREDDDARREGQHAADAAVPRAGLRRGHVRARVPARRARGEARPRPARAAPPQPRRPRARRRAAVQRQEPGRVLPARRAALGAPPRGARRARPRRSSAASGMASQIWYGGGGPPSYAWVRVGSDGRATVITALPGRRQRHEDRARADRGRGARPAARARDASSLGDSARGPYATLSGGSSTTPSMGPATRAAAADAKRQLLELAAQRYDEDAAAPHGSRAAWSSTPAASAGRSARCVGLLGNGQILGTGARGPNPAGMEVLTFGVQVAEVAVDVETGEVTVDRIAAIHDVGRVINPLGASSQVEGGIIQGIGHTLSEERLLDPATGHDPHAHARRLPAADDRRRAGDRLRARRRARRAADEPRREGPRRAADRPGRRGDRERDPRRDRRRRPLAADHARGDAAGAARGARAERGCSVELLRPSSLDDARPAATRSSLARRHRGRAAAARRPARGRRARRRARRCCRAGSTARGSARRRRWPSSRPPTGFPTRCARPRASPRRRSSAAWARSPATCSSRRAAGTGGSKLPVPPARRRPLPRRATASTASTRSSATTSARRRIRPTSRRRWSRSARRCGRTGASCRSPSSTGCRPRTTAARRRSSRAS